MAYQDIGLTLYLQDLWLKAFEGDILVIDYTGQPDAAARIHTFYIALCNYRRKVRKLKLNPLYKDEWARIERCRLFHINKTSFALGRKNKFNFSKRRTNQQKKLPWNSLELPKSVIYL